MHQTLLGVTGSGKTFTMANVIQKLQKLEVGKVTQQQALDYAEEMDLELMPDEQGKIIIMDDKDLSTFVNIINEDYWVSPLTGERYEIIKKRPLKVKESTKEYVIWPI